MLLLELGNRIIVRRRDNRFPGLRLSRVFIELSLESLGVLFTDLFHDLLRGCEVLLKGVAV